MEKLLKLLSQEYWEYWEVKLFNDVIDEEQVMFVSWVNHKWNIKTCPLTHILFSTDFLSILEWKQTTEYFVLNPNISYMKYDDAIIEQEKWFWDSDYHKINLVILKTDEERIQYIEEKTI